jgi:hypothetical protein
MKVSFHRMAQIGVAAGLMMDIETSPVKGLKQLSRGGPGQLRHYNSSPWIFRLTARPKPTEKS